MFVRNREDARWFFVNSWQKYKCQQPLEPQEKLILDVILAHPEYHELLDRGDRSIDREYSPDAGKINPFLHMGMHIAVKEQIHTDRPSGIRALCRKLLDKFGDQHTLEHKVMDCLGESLWLAQRHNTMPDETRYLEHVRALK